MQNTDWNDVRREDLFCPVELATDMRTRVSSLNFQPMIDFYPRR